MKCVRDTSEYPLLPYTLRFVLNFNRTRTRGGGSTLAPFTDVERSEVKRVEILRLFTDKRPNNILNLLFSSRT